MDYILYTSARFIRCAAALLALTLIPLAAQAQAPQPGVFSEVQTAILPGPNPAKEPATLRSRVVQVDTQKITAARRGRESLTLNLFDDAVVEVQINRINPTSSGYFISGRPKGEEWGEVRLVVNGPIMVGTVVTPQGKFTIRSGGSGRHIVRQIDPSKESFECEVEDAPLPDPSSLPTITSVGLSGAGTVSRPAGLADDLPTEDGSEIRILVVYTPAVEDAQGGASGIRALIDLMIQSTNQAFEDSGIDPRLVLAHVASVRYVEGAPFAHVGPDLERVRSLDDGYADEIHALRNQYAADLVHLVGLGKASGRAHAMSFEELRFESRAFSISFVEEGTPSEYVFAHEVGHNLGMLHDRYVEKSDQAIYPYAYGYVNKQAFKPDAPESARWRTLMAYNNRCTDARFFGGCEWLLRFSNPGQTYLRDSLGITGEEHVLDPDGPSDARRTINKTTLFAGSFRSEACTEFTVSPDRHVVSAGGGQVEIEVDTIPGCLWRVSTTDEFLTVTSDVPSASSGSIVIELEANQSGSEKSGIITVAGKNIAVVQLAKTEGVCGRSSGVFQAITHAAGYEDAARCDEVTDEELASITFLELRNKGLGSFRQGDFAGLSNLESLFLDQNELTGLPGSAFAGLPKLRQLGLTDNLLNDLPKDAFAGLSSLEILEISGNQLTSVPAELFGGLSKLQTIQMQFNPLTGLPAGLFNALVNLKQLTLANNRLAELPTGLFADLSSLQILSLESNRLTRLPAGLSEGLSNLHSLFVGDNRITLMEPGFFDHLSSLDTLFLADNRLTDLPAGLFNALANLKQLTLGINRFTKLPASSFSGLVNLQYLSLSQNSITDLSPGVFAELSNLQDLSLENNGLADLPVGLFTGLSKLESLEIGLNRLTTLRSGIFTGFSSLRRLDLRQNSLSSLPENLFSELPALEALFLSHNPIDPFPLPVILERVGDSQFKAVVPNGAPFALELPISVSSGGTIGGDAGSLTVPARGLESEPIAVTREAETQEAVSVQIGTLPDLPRTHEGYALRKGNASPLEILPAHATKDATLSGFSLSAGTLKPAFTAENTDYTAIVGSETSSITVTATSANVAAKLEFLDGNDGALPDTDTTADGHQATLSSGPNSIKAKVTSEDGTETRIYTLVVSRDGAGGVCARTPQVRDAIVEWLNLDDCADVTEEHLSTIEGLDISDYKNLSLKSGDFAGLSSLKSLFLPNNSLTSLPADIFLGLTALEDMSLAGNRLASFPVDVFSGLTSLWRLLLNSNKLESLPEGIFSDLASLTSLSLSDNRLTSLPADFLSGLSSLESIYLGYNRFTSLPPETFAGQQSIKSLLLQNNPISRLPEGIFSGLTSLEYLALGNLPLDDLPSGIFSQLTSIQSIYLGGASLSSLPADIFSGLTTLKILELHRTRLRSLPSGLFSDLTALQTLWLPENQLDRLQPDIFSGLVSLERLNLEENNLISLPKGVFSDLKVLEDLYLADNQLSNLGEGIFSGLSLLAELEIHRNVLDPLPLTVSLSKVGASQFRAITPAGAPFALVLPINIINSGSIEGDAGTVTIPAGATESEALSVMRMEGSQEAVALDIGTLPTLPLKHQGYVLEKDESLPVVILDGPKEQPPGQVTRVEVMAGIHELEVRWTAVPDASGYKVEWKYGEEDYEESRQSEVTGRDTTSYTITELSAGEEYTVRVIATRDNADDGPPSVELTGVPTPAHAGQVTDVEVTSGIEQLEVGWTAVSETNGYKVQWKSGDEDYDDTRQTVLTGGDTTSHTITGLVAGTEYTVRVIATRNNADDGPPSSEIIGIPTAAPLDQVMDIEVVSGVEELQISWTAVSDAGGYKVQWKSGDEDYDDTRLMEITDSDTTSHTVTGLIAGREYTVRVIATKENAADGTPSAEVTATPKSSAPFRVEGLELVPGVGQMDVSWSMVTDANGYKVQWKSGDEDFDDSRQVVLTGGDTVNHTITDLIAGTEYTVRVIATKAYAEDGLPSSEVTSIPKTPPPAQVTGVEATPGSEELDVSWTSVSDADGYKVQWKSGSQEYAEARQAVLIGTDTVSYTIIDLVADTEYTIRVTATKDNADDGEPSEEVTATPISVNPDVNSDGVLNGDDAQVIYQSYSAADQVGDGETGGTAASRQTLLAGYAGKANPSDDDLKKMIRKANVWREVGVDEGGDINEDGEINESDALVMYYAYTLESLVGNGTTGGTARFRQWLLASHANKANPSDEELKAMLRRANELRDDFG